MKSITRSRKRVTISAARLDEYLTEQLHATEGFENVSLSAGYRLRSPDADGCNWSGHVFPVYGTGGLTSEEIADAARPIVKAARVRFNISE